MRETKNRARNRARRTRKRKAQSLKRIQSLLRLARPQWRVPDADLKPYQTESPDYKQIANHGKPVRTSVLFFLMTEIAESETLVSSASF